MFRFCKLQIILTFLALSGLASAESVKGYNKPLGNITIFVPSIEGGGYDLTATALKRALIKEGLVEQVEIIRSPGAGGLIALAQFVESQRGRENAVLVGGRTILSAADHNRSSISLMNTTPIARINGAAIAIAVDKDSPIRDFGDLIEAVRSQPNIVQWIGGSGGGVDEALVNDLSAALGVDRHDIYYTAVPGGGDNVAEKLISGQVTAAVSSYEEFSSFVDKGEIRILAISTPERLPNLAFPTLMEYEVDVELLDWRGVFAPNGLDQASIGRLEQLFESLANSQAWADELSRHKWQNYYLERHPFVRFLENENETIKATANGNGIGPVSFDKLVRIVGRQYQWSIAAGLFSCVLLVLVGLQRYNGHRKMKLLAASLNKAKEETKRATEELENNLSRPHDQIDSEFRKWNLTLAEHEIGWMLLKGLSLKEIANVRGTSERTVRQQAQSLYSKAGVKNRSNLAAYFLEDICFDNITPDCNASISKT